MAQINIKDAAGNPRTAALVENTGKTAASNSLPVTMATEDTALMADIARSVAAPANIVGKFRDSFESYDPVGGGRWTEAKAAEDLIFVDGNALAASYLVISKSPLTQGSESSIELQAAYHYTMPTEIAVGLSISQRTVGQEFSLESVDTGATMPDVADIVITAISQASSVLTIDTLVPHGLSVGKSIGVAGCADYRANYPSLVVASIPSPTQITCTAGPAGTIPSLTIANPAGAKGVIYFRQRLGRARNGLSQVFENNAATTASLYARAEAGDAFPSGSVTVTHGVTVGTTTPVQLVAAAYTYAFGVATEFKMLQQVDRCQWADGPVDSTSQMSSRLVRNQVCPDPAETYKLRIRATNNKALTVPTAQIVSIAKTGTTTATVVTDRPHGLTALDPVVLYGVRDQTASAFPNLLTASAVVSVIDATTFTIVIGTAATVTSYGGYVAKVNGGNLMSALGANAVVATSAALSTLSDGTRQLVLIGNTTWAAGAIGDLLELVGCRNAVNGASLSLDGPWKLANSSTTVLTLVLPYAAQRALPADFTTTNCGGGIIKRTEMRISYVRIFDYERLRMEMMPRPAGDSAGGAPVCVQNALSATITEGTLISPTTFNVATTASTNATSVKTTPGTVFGVALTNNSAATMFVKLYNKASAPTVGTDVPVATIPVPANSMLAIEFGRVGKRFSLGIALAVTAAMPTADTAVTTAGNLLSVDYV